MCCRACGPVQVRNAARWIPAYAGMTVMDAGMTVMDAGMTVMDAE